MSLRIAHVTATFPPYRGGTGNVCYHNARELARRGHEVTVITATVPGAPDHEERDSFAVRRLRPLVRVGNAPVLPGLVGALRGFDVVHLHYPFFGGELTALAAAQNRSPLVVTYHQDVLLQGAISLVGLGLRYTAGRAVLRSAARVLFTSEDYGNASHIRPLLRGNEKRLGALPNGVDTSLFCPAMNAHELGAHRSASSGKHTVLLVAALDRAHYFKGVDVLLDALARLPAGFRGVIVGDGDLRQTYEARALELGIGERVAFAGRVSDTQLVRHYQNADVTVLPSITMGEAFGLVLVESLACGTPVVASDLPGVRTVVDHGRDGLLVPVRDDVALAGALQKICAGPALGRTMGERGRVKVERNYSWQAIGRNLEQIYRDVLEQHSPTMARVVRGRT